MSEALNWSGVFPAITTPFNEDGTVDHAFLGRHAAWMLDAGCHGIIACGSLGEGAALTYDEKVAVLKTCVAAAGDKPVILGLGTASTAEGVRIAKEAAAIGVRGLMVLPPFVYSTDWPEMRAHVEEIMRATELSCILYNNPIAYRTDFLPHQIAELAEAVPQMHGVKESTGDARRVTAIKALTSDRLTLLVGMDDAIVEGARCGATGWVAGLVNAFPAESVALWRYALDGDPRADDLYRWFLPLLRLDVVPKFVQYIKLAQERVGMGHPRVRAPRRAITGDELAAVHAVLDAGLATRPAL